MTRRNINTTGIRKHRIVIDWDSIRHRFVARCGSCHWGTEHTDKDTVEIKAARHRYSRHAHREERRNAPNVAEWVTA